MTSIYRQRPVAWLLASVLSISSFAVETIKCLGIQDPPAAMSGPAGEARGYLVDVARHAYANLGYALEVEFMPFARAFARLSGGENACMSLLPTAEREETLDFGRYPVLSVQLILMHNRRSNKRPFDGSLESLQNSRIGVLRGMQFGPKVGQLKAMGVEFDQANTLELLLRKLAMGRTDWALAYYMSFWSPEAIPADLRSQIELWDIPFDEQSIYVAFPKSANRRGLLDRLDSELERMVESGEFARKVENYGVTPRYVMPGRVKRP